MTALRLHAITATDAGQPRVLAGGAHAVAFRDLAAIVTDREKATENEPDAVSINEHRTIVDTVFKSTQVVLPTPVGITFRAEHVLTRWMELHYVALTDALSFVNDRVGARIHVSRAGRAGDDTEVGSDLAEVAGELFREMRRLAVASVPLTMEQVTGIALSGAFLVERERWGEFERAVAHARTTNPRLTLDLTGPWAPYDFVRMQFDD